MQIARLAITPDNQFKAVGSNPGSLAEAKCTMDGDKLSRESVEPATKMLSKFRTMAAQLAAMDNKEMQPKPAAPDKLKFYENFIPGRRGAHTEAESVCSTERARQAFSNGTDLATDVGRILTTKDLNQQGVNAELQLGPKGLGGPAEGSLPLPSETRMEVEENYTIAPESYYHAGTPAERLYTFSSADGKDTYKLEEKYKDGQKTVSSQSLTLDWATRTAEYTKE